MKPLIVPAIALATISSAPAAIMLGVLDDFSTNNGGWQGAATTFNSSEQRLDLTQGTRPRFAMFNTAARYSGAIDSGVDALTVRLMRPASDTGDASIRLVLFGSPTANRYTSTVAATVPADGMWRTFRFSIQEADLTRVSGTQDYATLTGAVNRVSFRHDPGTPNANGAALSGTVSFDDITAVGPVPELSSIALLGLASLALLKRRR